MTEGKDKDFVEFILANICASPEKLRVNRTVDERGVLIEVEADKDDMGTIIGREGKTVEALRTLLRVVGMKMNARVNLKIIEPYKGY